MAAFTLLELLVAMAITVILLVILFGTLSSALKIWEQGRARIQTYANARMILQRLSDELKGARATKDQIEFRENLASLSTLTPTPEKSENLFFVAPYPNLGAGDLCVLAYRHNSATYQLERAFKDSEQAWNGADPSHYKANGYNDLKWITFAYGVIEFEVRCYSQQDLDQNAAPAVTWDSTDSTKSNMYGATPRRIVIRLRVVDDKTLAKTKGMPTTSSTYQGLIAEAARDFLGEVTLPSALPTPTPTP